MIEILTTVARDHMDRGLRVAVDHIANRCRRHAFLIDKRGIIHRELALVAMAMPTKKNVNLFLTNKPGGLNNRDKRLY